MDTVEALGASAVGIAVTATFSQQQFARDLELRFPLLSDWNREVSATWGVQYDEWKGHRGLAKRAVFVVDRDAVIAYRFVTDDAEVLPDYAAVLDALRHLHDAMPAADPETSFD